MNENNETETEAPTKEELATRVEQLEATVEKMIPTRREALGMGASAVAAGGLSQLLFGEAKAGSQQSGTIGSQSNVHDWYVEDLYDHNGNQPLSLPGNGSVEMDELVIGKTLFQRDSNSPINISSASSSTYTVGHDFDHIVVIPDTSTTGHDQLQVNGDTGSNYDFVDNADAQTSAATQWDINRAQINTRLEVFDNGSNVQMSTIPAHGITGQPIGGRNNNLGGNGINSLTFIDSGGSARSLTAEVYGREI